MQTHVLTGLRGKRFTPEGFRPLEAKLVHQGFTAGPRLLAQPPAGGHGRPRHTLGREDGAQERLQLGGALDLDERPVRLQSHPRLPLSGVAHDVGQDGVGVREVSAERDGDRLTQSRGRRRRRRRRRTGVLTLRQQEHTSVMS